mgnify:CR=1 FL=1
MGITEIQTKYENEKANQQSSGNMELWLKDGDIAYVAIIPSGEENDHRLGDFWIHSDVQTITQDTGEKKTTWTDYLCMKTLDKACERCVGKNWPGHKFAFWVHALYILHAKQANEEWEPIKSQTGVTKYKEEINKTMLYKSGFGKGGYLWNQVVDLYGEIGKLNTNVVRIGRRGEKLDTSYTIAATQNPVKLPKDVLEQIAALPNVVDYYVAKLGGPAADEGPDQGETEKTKPSAIEEKKKVGRPSAKKTADVKIESPLPEEDEDLAGDLF